jgi:hypothetical protein
MLVKIYPVYAEDGQKTSAFEIEHIYISLTTIARLLAKVDGIMGIHIRKMFAGRSDVHIEFNYHGQPYVVWEPYGDNSRYWIGPEDEAVGAVNDIAELECAFKYYKPTLFRKILGDVLTFQFIFRGFLKKSKTNNESH